jgi:hypothetical protein
MSEDLIRRSDAIEAITYSHLDNLTREERIAHINAIPSADRPQGEWIDMGDFEQCSVCKGTRLKEFQSYYGKTTWVKTPYCPNCGARMKGADDE